MRARITFTNPADVHMFGVGDRVSGGSIVVKIDHGGSAITIAPATWWRVVWYWCREQVKHAWWWTRCTWADIRERAWSAKA